MNTAKQTNSSSIEAVIGNDELITEILLRVPAKSVLKFKLVSKRWLSIISNSSFAIRHSHLNPHTTSSLLLKLSFFLKQSPCYTIVSLDGKSSVSLSYDFLNFDPNNPENTYVSQSCNGLILCSKWRWYSPQGVEPKEYIFNPTTRQSAILPLPPDQEKCFNRIQLVFDPYRSPCYQVVCAQFFRSELKILVYSPETKAWKLAVNQENLDSLSVNFDNGVSWNGSIHWMRPNGNGLYFWLNKECLQIMPRPALPENWEDQNFRYFGESGGYLLFIGFLPGNQIPDGLIIDIVSSHMSPDQITDESIVVYAMERDYSKWFVRYCLHMIAIVKAYPEIIKDASTVQSSFSVKDSVDVLSFVEGNNETGPLMVMRIPGGIITYSFKDKTFNKILSFASFIRATCEAFNHCETLSWI